MNPFKCPRCGRVSYNPDDIRHGYCGFCHDYTGQEDLFDICARRHKGNPESQEANQRTSSNKLRDRARIMEFLNKHGGHTAEEIEKALGMRRSTVSARMSELKRDNMITKIGRRPTSTGSTAGIYDTA